MNIVFWNCEPRHLWSPWASTAKSAGEALEAVGSDVLMIHGNANCLWPCLPVDFGKTRQSSRDLTVWRLEFYCPAIREIWSKFRPQQWFNKSTLGKGYLRLRFIRLAAVVVLLRCRPKSTCVWSRRGLWSIAPDQTKPQNTTRWADGFVASTEEALEGAFRQRRVDENALDLLVFNIVFGDPPWGAKFVLSGLS